MTAVHPETAQTLDLFPGPILIACPDGRLVWANRAATDLAGVSLVGRFLADLAVGAPDGPSTATLLTFLDRAARTSAPMVGTIVLPTAAGAPARLHCHGARAPGPNARVLLRCVEPHDDRFATLTRRIGELSEETRRRRHAQAVLEETLKDRDLLLREIHHRVKNNIHMLAGMLGAAVRETDNAEARAVLADAVRRIGAMGAIQQTLYRSDRVRHAHSDDLLATLRHYIAQSLPETVEITLSAATLDIPNDVAVPLALIVNELVVNAARHGVGDDGRARVAVQFDKTDDHFELVVQDHGPGFEPAEPGRRSSGLGLVRGLARQLGGSLSIEKDDGARCRVRFETPTWRAAEVTS